MVFEKFDNWGLEEQQSMTGAGLVLIFRMNETLLISNVWQGICVRHKLHSVLIMAYLQISFSKAFPSQLFLCHCVNIRSRPIYILLPPFAQIISTG